ncbi:MAG: hypothetical protein OEZ01_16950, partial [Candidatus Heimdallarchaeota archaeon]|nr:hypothetical protein [Candidatus Heimdallarchaeota archaeon]
LQNINPETINNLQITASKLGLTTGELLNTMMKKSLENDKFPTITSTDLIDIDKIKPVFNISHHENLFIAKKDLDFDGKVSFNNIEVLKFDKDIDENLFCDKIHSINHCKEIYLPKISKLLAFAKLHSCISVYIP